MAVCRKLRVHRDHPDSYLLPILQESSSQIREKWTDEENKRLLDGLQKNLDKKEWISSIAKIVKTKTYSQVKNRLESISKQATLTTIEARIKVFLQLRSKLG